MSDMRPEVMARPAGAGLWIRCTVMEAGAAEDQRAYIRLAGEYNQGSFNLWFYAADVARREILATALAAITGGCSVDAVVGELVNLTQLDRLYLVAPGA